MDGWREKKGGRGAKKGLERVCWWIIGLQEGVKVGLYDFIR